VLSLSWISKSTAGRWLPLKTVNLDGVTAQGVYMIWHGGNPSRVVRVGQGDIPQRLKAHRLDPAILDYERFGLYVTWAAVPVAQRDGVERFLANAWRPLVGDTFPQGVPIAVNSPW
jgi:hypothetical protein